MSESQQLHPEKPPPRFKIGDRVRIAHAIISSDRFLIGKICVVEEIDDIVFDGRRIQTNYEASGHYLNDEMLEPA